MIEPDSLTDQSMVTAANSIAQASSRPFGNMVRRVLSKYFYFLMSLLIVAAIVYGFSFTVEKNLIHPAVPRPWILYVHATIFTGWLAFFLLQTILVRSRKVTWHRRLGGFGVVLGSLIPIVGISTAIVMGRFDIGVLHLPDVENSLIVPLFDMVCFTSTFPLAVYWRKKPELHRRLMLVAVCALTAAGFGRFVHPDYLFYGGVDLLILLGVVRDLILDRRIHRVYLIVLPLFIVGQVITTYVAWHGVPFWMRIAHRLLQ